jgi:hypothetical protein
MFSRILVVAVLALSVLAQDTIPAELPTQYDLATILFLVESLTFFPGARMVSSNHTVTRAVPSMPARKTPFLLNCLLSMIPLLLVLRFILNAPSRSKNGVISPYSNKGKRQENTIPAELPTQYDLIIIRTRPYH